MRLTISDITKIICEEVDKFNARQNGLDKEVIMNGITLYHRPKDATVTVGGKKMSIIDSLFKYGFNREFTGSNGGNMYGAGVYTVYNLRSSNEKATGYGSAIIKLKLIGGYKDFLIFSEQLAKETYGERWHIKQQVLDLFPKGEATKILNNIRLYMHDDRASFHNMRTSSVPAHQIIRLLGEQGMNNSKVRGLIYNGGHDGACCFIRDFSSVIPVAVSYDNGQTWQYKLNDELIDRISTEVDTHFQYKSNKEFADVSDKSINGYTMVWNKEGKVNYVSAQSSTPISKVWFDAGENWQRKKDGTLYTTVKVGEYYIQIYFEDGQYNLYEENGCPLDATLDELPELIGA